MSSETKPFLTYHSNSSISSTTTLSPSTSSQPSYKQKILHDIRSNIVSYTIVFALTTLLWMSIVFSFIPDESTQYHLRTSHPDARRHNVTSGMTLLTCGETKTNEEALEKGCKYDVLLNGWVPSPCYDQEFVRLSSIFFFTTLISSHLNTPSLTSYPLRIDNRIPRRLLCNSLPLPEPHSSATFHH